MAIDLIQKGCNGEASEILSEAVSDLSKCVLSNREQQEGRDHAKNCMDGVSIYSADILAMNPSVENGDFFFHPFGFECVVATSDQEDDSLTNKDFSSCAITCLYNLGLCYHMEWFKYQKTSTDKLLCKALYFYRQAFSFTSDYTMRPQDPILQVLMAISTNAAHCSVKLADLDQFRYWNKYLGKILNFCQDRRKNHVGFFILTTQLNSYAIAAAAAA
eukprot:CAMPEP_0172470502 /NCGR_PEP_ID=MMETSP1065-20121228/66495_1 /TAXON_ID=265537 /ORGANISM="Amphiprora paludosa, Strain CCMP125" /LENGTH=216 /DNA_ID=CAMNT_0013228449 /DNA_START=91 /DNA_END=741 /DNA_ORIENTATION=+